MLVLLRHRVLGRLQLLGKSVLLLGVFRRRKQRVGRRADDRRYKELEEDLRGI